MITEEQKARNRACQVLVVDDEEIVLVALRETLRQLGYTVFTAPDAMQGMSLLKLHPFAIVLTDHQMPRLTGLEFLAQVKALQPDASRVLITAVLNLTTVINAINRAEIFRFLIKPWQREDLVETLAAAADRHRQLAGDRRLLTSAKAEIQNLGSRVRELEHELARVRRG